MTTLRSDQQPDYRPGVHRFAIASVVATFLLIVLGGTVTSKGVGLSVPDWPTTYGYNMFGVPLDVWIGRGGVFWEHAHRLAGSAVGVMSIILTMLIWLPYWNVKYPYRFSFSRPFIRHETTTRTQDRPWLRWLALASLLLVIFQGVMGGLRVTEMSVTLAVLHGVTAQVFLCVTVLLAAATSRWWLNTANTTPQSNNPLRFSVKLRRLSLALLAVMAIQLMLGASMRHTGSRLAIPDFPSAYGQLIPPLTEAGIQQATNDLPYDEVVSTYSPAQVGLHFSHRVWAVAVVAIAIWLLSRLAIEAGNDPRLAAPMTALVGLLLTQLTLGALVIWTGHANGNNDIATAHQATGAALLATATLLAIRLHVLPPTPHRQNDTAELATHLKGATA